MSLLEYRGLSSSEDVTQLQNVLAQCFNISQQRYQVYLNRISKEQFRIICQADRVIGGLAMMPMKQWWGGRQVALTGLASVGVVPEHRGEGAAIALLQQTLRELYTSNVALSVLFPLTPSLYQRVGYGQGGVACGWEMPIATISRQARPLPLHRISANPLPVLQSLHQQQAILLNGQFDRHLLIWQRLFQTRGQEMTYAYLVGSPEQPEGYVIINQPTPEQESNLRIKDWCILTSQAGHSLWAFIANHRSQAKTVRWRGGVIDPLTALLTMPTTTVRRLTRWMLRIVDVRLALAQRGYASQVATELHFEIQDDLLPANNDKFILSIANGIGTVSQGGRGELKLPIQGLASLYTGLFSPYQLKLMGQLQAPDVALNAASSVFAGSPPWTPDFF